MSETTIQVKELARRFDPESLTSSARTRHTRESVSRFEETKPGTTEKVSRFLRPHPQGISNTLRAGTASDHGAHTAPRPIHPERPRVITVREAARLHGYPDWFRFHTTKWNGFREIGSSVPIRLGRAVGSSIMEAGGGSRKTPRNPWAGGREAASFHAVAGGAVLRDRRQGDPPEEAQGLMRRDEWKPPALVAAGRSEGGTVCAFQQSALLTVTIFFAL